MEKTVKVNERMYSWPSDPVVVICCDGCEPAYIKDAQAKGLMPNLDRIIAKGSYHQAECVIPSFTNPNNLSIATGRPPLVHGISGNFFRDRVTGKDVMMNDPKYLRAPTIFSAFHQAGAKVAVVTAKDKLRRLLGHGLTFDDGLAVCIASEKADQCTIAENGIEDVVDLVGMPVPEVYSLELSEFVFAAGVKLMEAMRPDLMYLSTSDYIQHKFAPGTDGANAFYAMMDRYLGQLDDSGAVVVVTADHGMKAKHLPNGKPDVIYLQDELDAWLGKDRASVILPITDPYVIHHGALGSFATVYLDPELEVDDVMRRIRDLPGIQVVVDGKQGCATYELPEDRLGDIIVISRDTKVIGTRRTDHDLEALKEPLRSHGGITEQVVPMIVNRTLIGVPASLRNFDAFALGLNHVASTTEEA